MDRAAFFAAARAKPFGGSLSQSAVDGCDAILDAWETYGDGDANKLAYVLATAFHETGATMAPVVENLNYSAAGLRSTFPSYFTAAQATAYARQPEKIANRAYANRIGNGSEASGDGWRHRGRGYAQLTGRANYADWAKRTGLDLIGNPDLARDPLVAARILVQGSMLGTFTGKKLGDYIGGSKVDFTNARRVINGTDKAAVIAGYAESFAAAIRAATKAIPTPEPAPKPAPLPTAPDPAIGTVGQSIIASLTIEMQDLKRRVEILEAERG